MIGRDESDLLGIRRDVRLVAVPEILVEDDLELHAGTVFAEQIVLPDEASMLRRVVQVQLDDNLRRRGRLPCRKLWTYCCVVSWLNRCGGPHDFFGEDPVGLLHAGQPEFLLGAEVRVQAALAHPGRRMQSKA